MASLANDVRYALRATLRARVFSIVAIACLAVGIAVNVAAFSVLNALLLRDYPGVQRQDELTAIVTSHETQWGRTSPGELSTLDWEVFRNRVQAFSSSGVWGSSSVVLRMRSGPVAVRADFVSGEFFATLGTAPAAGRLLTDRDDAPGAEPAAVISYTVWQTDFGGQPDAIGQALQVGDAQFTIVGVAPRGFVGLNPGELVADPEWGAAYVYLPLAAAPLVRPQSRYASETAALEDDWLVLVGRRRSGATQRVVQAHAQVAAAALAARYPDERTNAAAAVRYPNGVSPAQMYASVAFAMSIPVLILLVACANLANQLLARAVHRGREVAVRLALGASRAQLVRLLLAESTLLALAASVVGVLLARWCIDALPAFALVIPFHIWMDVRVVVFTVALALITALAFGLVPSLRATRRDLAESFREGASGGGYRRSRLRSGLVVTQVAASVALLALAGVLVRGAQRSHISEDPANVNRILTLSADLDLLGYTREEGAGFQAQAVEGLQALPAVEAVAVAPFAAAGSIPGERVRLPGGAPDRYRTYETMRVGGEWFAVRNTRALAGRLFTPAELQSGAPVAVVDMAAARRLWPDQSPLGQSLRIGEDETGPVSTVIGVIATIRDRHGHNDDGVITVPRAAGYDPRIYFYLRTRGNAADVREPARAVIQRLDARLPAAKVATLAESLDNVSAPTRQMAYGVGVMGTIALLLAAIGLAAVLSFIIEQRRFEIGVRMALGAEPIAVVGLVVRQSLALTLLGIGIGGVIAGLGATLLRGILFGLPPIDAVGFAGAITAILLVATLSSMIPARRAARVDPLVALRPSDR
jgi:predicted permease